MAGKYKLIIVESPAKAKTIGKFLGKGYHIEASNGHVRDLPRSSMGIDIDHDFEPKYITIRGRGPIIERIKREAKNASAVYLATDPDREGEAISWHLAHLLKIEPQAATRIEFHEITKSAVVSAIENPRPLDIKKIDSQQARRVLDRLVGYKISPLLWAKIRKGLSAGRVQSVATRMIVDREREIDAFVPEEFWNIHVKCTSNKKSFAAKYIGEAGKPREQITTGERAAEIEKRIKKGGFSVDSVKKSERRKNPPPPFTTSNLQQDAARKLGFTTSKTMMVAQQLYEGVDIESEGTVGLVSYIRTDSTRVSDDAMADVRAHISANYQPEYLPGEPNIYKSRRNAQDAHEAIRPTSLQRSPEAIKDSLTKDQYRLYKLIYTRFIASQMTPALYDVVTARITNGDVDLQVSGMKKRFAGFTLIYEEGRDAADTPEDEKETALPALTEGSRVEISEITPEQKFTQPPPRYTEAALVKALEEQGIGRPSTYAPTIATIISRDYITRKSRTLFPTDLGMVVTDLMSEHFSRIVDTEFTASMEERLDEVEDGSVAWQDVVNDFYGEFKQAFEKAEQLIEKIEIKDEPSDVPCSKCGAMMVYKMGRYGKFLACPNYPECKNTQPIVVDTGVPCPDCGGAILERTSRKGKKFYGCSNYPECSYTLWDMPSSEKCPQCGSIMVKKTDRKQEDYLLCSNQECKHKTAPERTDGDER